jgi:hypothetical protein
MPPEQTNERKLDFVPVPYSVFTDSKLSPTEKLLIGRLKLYAGKDGRCYPSHHTLAREFGMSRRGMQKCLDSLREKGRIDWTENPGKSNAYTLLVGANSSSHPGLPDVNPDSQEGGTPVRRGCEPQFAQKEVVKEDLKESSIDESASSSEKQTETPPWYASDLEELGDRLRASRASSRTAQFDGSQEKAVTATPPPDRKILGQILAEFLDASDFQEWLSDTETRELGAKAKSNGWALYLTDAKNWCEANRSKREAAQRERREEETRREARKRAMETPVPVAEAVTVINAVIDRPAWALSDRFWPPAPLQWRLERTGELIAPVELRRQARAWKRCVECEDCGTLGNTIDKDLRFCTSTCTAADELRLRKGEEYPVDEIARVNADMKSLMIEACRLQHRDVTGDALEQSEVVETTGAIEIRTNRNNLL